MIDARALADSGLTPSAWPIVASLAWVNMLVRTGAPSSDACTPSHSPRWVITPSTRDEPHSVRGVSLMRLSPPGSR